MQSRCAAGLTVMHSDIHDREISDAANVACIVELRSKRFRYRRTGGQKINIGATRAVMPRRLCLLDVTVFTSPPDFPAVHFAQTRGPILAEHRGKPLVAKAAACGECICEVMLPMI